MTFKLALYVKWFCIWILWNINSLGPCKWLECHWQPANWKYLLAVHMKTESWAQCPVNYKHGVGGSLSLPINHNFTFFLEKPGKEKTKWVGTFLVSGKGDWIIIHKMVYRNINRPFHLMIFLVIFYISHLCSGLVPPHAVNKIN